MDAAFVISETKDGVAYINFFHPQGNSLPGSLLKLLAEKIELAGEDNTVKVIVLKSGGEGAFCAGASFDELLSISDYQTSKNFFSGFAKVINAIRKAPKFVIARVQGKCVGGGVGIAAAADYSLALDTASIRLSELSIGIGPFVIGPAVQRKIGVSAFSLLSINAVEWKSAQWAMEKGMYANIYSSAEELDKALEELTERLSASDAGAMFELKKIFWEGTEDWDELLLKRAETVAQLSLSNFSKDAIKKLKK